MTIRAERHSEHEDQDKKGNYVRCERSYGSYQRAFDISGVEVADISAQYNDGVLKLNMPKKSAVVNAKQIKIISRLRARNFFGLYGVVQKILAKVRSYERAFSFFRRAAAGKGEFAPRAAARTTVTCRLTAARVIRTQKAA